ncbi:MAG TPA: ATP-binding protein [Bdellovibrionota bacterium]|nr:ATP-binding protein [Bdellovibrionota bacterium]
MATPNTAEANPRLKPRRKSKKDRDILRGRVRAHDPFELIRWLALSQPDPRKALAELVQNSLDAGARRIRVVRVREKGVPCLKVFDDGSGVIPEMERPDALRYIATHIGHSRKRSLSPQERLALLTQGQYGIGLLGFWSLGQMLEMRSFLPGQPPYRLVLYRDRPDFLIEPLRGRLSLGEKFTEVIVLGLHTGAMGALVGRRMADFLSSELRGQLLAREVELVVEDRMARGAAKKPIHVRPPRFLGERLSGIGPLPVPGYPEIRMEFYFSGENDGNGERLGIGIYSSGSLVAQGFHELGALGLDHPPWTDPRLSGFVDFSGFAVAPGSRRGVAVDDAAEAFAKAFIEFEPVLAGVLESLEHHRSKEQDRSLIRDLQRAFRDFYRHRPRYALLPVTDLTLTGAPDGNGGSETNDAVATELPPPEREDETFDVSAATLLPPGPLEKVRISPETVKIVCGGRKNIRALPLDSEGQAIKEAVEFRWAVSGTAAVLVEETMDEGIGRATLEASDRPGAGTLSVIARGGGREARAEVAVEVLEEIYSRRSKEGIPEPEFVSQPGAPWRSRVVSGRWEVNAGHLEYRALADRPALRLRYLAMLFAKEVVLQSHQDPRLEAPLEQLVEVAAYADLELSSKRKARNGA